MTPIKKALATWYKPDSPLYKNPEPATLGLAGEVGELVDLYKKHVYKPRFDWMNCKYCGISPGSPVGNFCQSGKPKETHLVHTPIVIDELGDIWYYLRILAWMKNTSLHPAMPSIRSEEQRRVYHDLFCVTAMYKHAANLVFRLDPLLVENDLQKIHFYLRIMLANLGYTIEKLTKLNYKKLNSESSNHGWKEAK
jgi:hypothetical protein